MRAIRFRRAGVFAFVLDLAFVPGFVWNWNPARAEEMYQQPPEPISQILDAEPTPFVSVSPDQTWLLFLERNALPTIEEASAPELGLAGMRIDPTTNGPSRSVSLKGLRLRSIDGETERPVAGSSPIRAAGSGIIFCRR